MSRNCVVVHYSEVGLKGKNRGFFILKLIRNIEKSLHGIRYNRVYGIPGRIIVEVLGLDEKSKTHEKKIKERFFVS